MTVFVHCLFLKAVAFGELFCGFGTATTKSEQYGGAFLFLFLLFFVLCIYNFFKHLTGVEAMCN
jgi:hypothetical protein